MAMDIDMEKFQQQWQLQLAQYYASTGSGDTGSATGTEPGASNSTIYDPNLYNNNNQNPALDQGPGPTPHGPMVPKKRKKPSKFKEDPQTEGELVDKIVNEMKSRGLVDQFRKDVMGGCEENPFFQQLDKRVSNTVRTYLDHVKWLPTLNRNVVRESMRRKIVDSSYFNHGIEKILTNVMHTKANGFFMPSIEEGLEAHMEPKKDKNKNSEEPKEENPSTSSRNPPLPPLPDPDKLLVKEEDEEGSVVDMECDSESSENFNSNSNSNSNSLPPEETKNPSKSSRSASSASSISGRSRSRSRSRKNSSSENSEIQHSLRLPTPPLPTQQDFIIEDSEDIDMEIEDDEEEESPAFEKIGETLSPLPSPIKTYTSSVVDVETFQLSPDVSPLHYFPPLSSPIKRKLSYFSKYVDPLLMESDVSLLSVDSGDDEADEAKINVTERASAEADEANINVTVTEEEASEEADEANITVIEQEASAEADEANITVMENEASAEAGEANITVIEQEASAEADEANFAVIEQEASAESDEVKATDETQTAEDPNNEEEEEEIDVELIESSRAEDDEDSSSSPEFFRISGSGYAEQESEPESEPEPLPPGEEGPDQDPLNF